MAGRPPVVVDLVQVEELTKIGCTVEEVANVLKVSRRTLETRKDCKMAIASGRLECKSSIRRMQYKAAEKGNTVMLIWLGKQLLGQKDRVEQSVEDGQLDQLVDAIRRS